MHAYRFLFVKECARPIVDVLEGELDLRYAQRSPFYRDEMGLKADEFAITWNSEPVLIRTGVPFTKKQIDELKKAGYKIVPV